MSLRTPLSKARGLGSAKEGLHHWIAQRVSAIALLLLSVWFISALLSASSQGKDIVELVANPFHAVAFVLFLGTALYHGALGLQVVIEDYVHCECGKTILLLAVKFVAIVTAVAAILAILTFHVQGGGKSHGGKYGYGKRPCYSQQVGREQCKRCHKAGKPCGRKGKMYHGEGKLKNGMAQESGEVMNTEPKTEQAPAAAAE